jgi:hypothetical protein
MGVRTSDKVKPKRTLNKNFRQRRSEKKEFVRKVKRRRGPRKWHSDSNKVSFSKGLQVWRQPAQRREYSAILVGFSEG